MTTTSQSLQVLRALSARQVLEKVAAESQGDLAESAAYNSSQVSNELTQIIKTAGRVIDTIDFVLSVRDASASTGVKLASDAALIQDATQKLAAALVVDDALCTQMTTGSEEEKTAAVSMRSLGREYIAELTQLLLA